MNMPSLDSVAWRALLVLTFVMVLWLTEALPLFVTSLLLVVAIPLVLGPLDSRFELASVLMWAANPILSLFFGGFALGVAGRRHGLDEVLAGWFVRLAGGHQLRLLAAITFGTGFLSMWMSNVAAAALMLTVVRPLQSTGPEGLTLRRALLLGIAFGANFGGIATPIGTGPNAIVLGLLSPERRITFPEWMFFALPLTVCLLTASVLLLALLHRVRGTITVSLPVVSAGDHLGALGFLIALTIIAWLSEPLHGVSAPVIALLLAATLFAGRLLQPADLAKIDWATLIVIAGGLVVGRLIGESGLAVALTRGIDFTGLPVLVLTIGFVTATAALSAIGSNTAATALIAGLATTVSPSDGLLVLIAIGASLGAPFVISTPPNTMVFGEGGLRTRDLLIPGGILMLGGIILVSLTGRQVLRFAGLE